MTNFGPLAAEICWRVWGTPANFNGFRVLAALLHGIPVLGGINQTLRRWTQGATYIWQGGHHVGHWPTFLVFVIFLHILAKIWLQWQRSLQPCNQKCLLCIGRPRKPPAISNEILFISCRNAFVAILVPKLVAVVMPLCSVCTGVSQMSSPMAQTLSQNQLYMDMLHTAEVMAIFVIFCIFWPKFGRHGNVPLTLAHRNVFLGLVEHKNPLL